MTRFLIFLIPFLLAYSDPQEKSQPVQQCKKAGQSFRGCCSHHRGVLGCSHYRVICRDGTTSPTCRCKIESCKR